MLHYLMALPTKTCIQYILLTYHHSLIEYPTINNKNQSFDSHVHVSLSPFLKESETRRIDPLFLLNNGHLLHFGCMTVEEGKYMCK